MNVICINNEDYTGLLKLKGRYKVIGITVELGGQSYYDISGHNGLYPKDCFIEESEWIEINRDNKINELLK